MEKLEVGKRVRLVRHSVKTIQGRLGTVVRDSTPKEWNRPTAVVVKLDVPAPSGDLKGEEWLCESHEVQPEYALETQYAVRFTDDQGRNQTVKLWAPDAHAALEMAPGTRNKAKRAAFFARVFEVTCCGSRKYPDQE